MTRLRWAVWFRAACALGLLLGPAPGRAQTSQPTGAAANSSVPELIRELKGQIAELQSAVAELRAEASRYRAETQELRRELHSAVTQGPGAAKAAPPPAVSPEAAEAAAVPPGREREDERLAKLEDEYDLLSGKVDEQYQTKLESASKYRVRLSGIVLLNLFSNRGAVDNQDVPSLALPPAGRYGGSFGGTMRQSQLGLEVFGPTVAGARTRADLQLDFAGGFAQTANGVTMGIVRLRTAAVRLDWPRTSIIAGQEAPFFTPLSPTSLASLAQPALAYAGNLWTWVPQLRVERRLVVGERSTVTLQGGILDPLTGEPPPPQDQFDRVPQAGEASRQPGYAARLAWKVGAGEQPMSLGIGGYYSRQDWQLGRHVDGWAVTADWSIPLGRLFSVTGEFYRGRALGGLGGAVGRTVLYSGPPASTATEVHGLDAMGGWTQLKLRATSTLEFNAAAGQDNPFASQIRSYVGAFPSYNQLTVRNRSSLMNLIYRPRSDLLFSLEYRHIRTFELDSMNRSADHINVMMGVLF